MQSKKRAVFLDRDGGLNEVIIRNGKPYPPRDLSELVITNGTREALDELKREGFLQIVVTNQPDVARAPQIAPISKRSTRSLALFCRSIR